jgi:hypothetical protein
VEAFGRIPKLKDSARYTLGMPDAVHAKQARMWPIPLPAADAKRANAYVVNRQVMELIWRWEGKMSLQKRREHFTSKVLAWNLLPRKQLPQWPLSVRTSRNFKLNDVVKALDALDMIYRFDSLGNAAAEIGVRLMAAGRHEEMSLTEAEAARLAEVYGRLLEEIRGRIQSAYGNYGRGS